jgi:hypothetical protein
MYLMKPASKVFCLCVAATFFSGCTTSRTTDTARTGIEQLLISNAVDQTLDKTAFPAVSGRKVFVEEKYLDCVDKGYVVGSIRQKLLSSGAHLVDAKDGSDVTIEIVSGGLGTDNIESYLGVPGLTVPGLPVEIPEVRVYEKKSQFGTAKLGIVAYTTTTGEMLYSSGGALARAEDSRWSVMGIGPFQEGSVNDEVNRNTVLSGAVDRVAGAVDFGDSKVR